MQALIGDSETSGLTHTRFVSLDKQPEVIELYLAYVDLDTGEILGEFDSKFKPSKPLDDTVKRVTHIKDEDLENAPLFSDRAHRIKEIIEKSPFVIFHNASFDKEIIDIEMERLGLIVNWPRVICSVEQTIHLKGYRLKLTDLHELLFGEKMKEAHRAKIDTDALIKCCCELRKRGIL